MAEQHNAWNREVSGCTDPELMKRLQLLAASDRKLVARLVVYLGEVDARGLFREHAYSNMHDFVVKELRMSDAEAYLRVQAARMARSYPVMISLLATGDVHLSTLRQIAPVLTPENHMQWLERIRGKTKREVECLLAELYPKPDAPSRTRRLPEQRSGARAAARAHVSTSLDLQLTAATAATTSPTAHGDVTGFGTAETASAASETPGVGPANSSPAASPSATTTPAKRFDAASVEEFFLEPPPAERSSWTPLGAGRYRLQWTAHQALHDKLEQLKHLMRHQVPDGNLAVIVERAVDLLLDKTLKARFGVKAPSDSRPAPTQHAHPSDGPTTQVCASDHKTPASSSRHIARAVAREVFLRDQGQCSFVGSNAKRCCERGLLELHHVVPFARGGEASVENIRLVCRAHNSLLAEQDFGRAHVRSKRARGAERARQHSFEQTTPPTGESALFPEKRLRL